MKRKKVFIAVELAVICVLVVMATLSACNSKPDYLSYVSELRKDVFIGEQDNFYVVVYAGSKESPATFDGIKQDSLLCLGFKIIQKEDIGSQITVKFNVGDKQYSAPLTFNPVKSTLFCDVVVSALPEKNFTVEVCYGEESVTVNTVSQLNENTVSYTRALESAASKGEDFLKEHTQKGVLKAEIVIRLLCENGKNYYYVGFICDKGLKKAYLIEGSTGEVIAEKDN